MLPDDGPLPLAVRKVVFRRMAYMVGEHPWAGAGFKHEREAWLYFRDYTNSMEPKNETPELGR